MDQSLLELLPRMGVSMVVVIAIMWGAARLLKNRQISGLGNGKRTPAIQVLSKQGLGKHSSISVVRTGDKVLVLGITQESIHVLTELDDFETDTINLTNLTATQSSSRFTKVTTGAQRTGVPASGINSAANQTRKGLLSQIREMTVRKA